MAKDKTKKKKIKIPKKVMQLKWSMGKFAKKNDLAVKKKAKKKERKEAKRKLLRSYSEFVITRLNSAASILSKMGTEETRKSLELREAIIQIIAQNDVMKQIAKIYKKEPDNYPYIVYLPFMIRNAILYYSQDNLSEDDAKLAEMMDRDALVSISEAILKKQAKKYRENGLSKHIALEVASAIPTAKRISNNRRWMKSLIQLLYELAEFEEVDFEAVLKTIPKLDKKPPYTRKEIREMFYRELIQARSSNKNHSFTESQKDLNEKFIESAMEYLNGLKHQKLRQILREYIKIRKKAEEHKNDGKRIIKFTDIANSNSDYEKIKTVVTELISDDSANELYLS
jgi:flagellar biosynthesis regulator FlaF